MAISDQHWEECYVSAVIRAIDNSCKLPSAGKFLKNFVLSNKPSVQSFLRKFFKLINLTNTSLPSRTGFQNVDNSLYEIHWSIGVLVGYLERVKMLEAMLEFLGELEDGIMLHLLKGIITYKLK